MDETTVATPVETVEAPAAVIPAKPRDLDSLSPKQYHDWKMTGEIPAEEPEPVKAEVVAEPEVKPESKNPKRLGYGELRKRVQELEGELAARTTAPKAPPAEEPKAKAEKLPPKPTTADKNEDGTPKYKTWEEYNEDLIDWKAEQKLADWRKGEEKAKQEATQAEKNTTLLNTWNERAEKAAEKYADFEEVALDPKKGPGAAIQPGSVVDAWILRSDMGPELLYHFGKNRNELKRIGQMDPLDATRELTKLEIKLSGEPSKTPPTPEPKVTRTPRPASDIGGRGTVAVDEVTKAVADNDTGAYIRAQNAKEIAGNPRFVRK